MIGLYSPYNQTYRIYMICRGMKMPNYPFMQVDAFTTVALGGNPCAIIFEADDLDDAKRLAIAKEMNL